MCGIFGVVGHRPAGPILLEGLKKLEYRGYDSCGIASVSEGKLHVRKGIGKIDEVEQRHGLSGVPGTVALSHSRWATHGGVTDQNAHPHTDCAGRIAIVHNGIIENFQELKRELHQKGHRIASQTDTELIAHLLEEFPGSLETKMAQAAARIRGSFALLAVSTEEPHKMVALRCESPLVIGIGSDAIYAASDVMPFLEHTDQAIFLEDHEMAVITPGAVSFENVRTRSSVNKKPRTLQWTAEQAGKEGHPHFMIKEILEQPAAIQNAMRQDPDKLEKFVQLIRNSRDVKFVACGTSRHAALVGRYAINRLAGKTAEVYIASEFSYFADQSTPDTLIIAVSQSGETADVLVGLRKAKAKGAKVASIVNVVGSSIDRESDASLSLNCGPEIAVASTKAFTAQLVVLYVVAHALAGKSAEGTAALKQVAAHAADLMPQWNETTRALAASWTEHEHVYFLGRGVNFPVALEGALKLKEISYIHAEGMPAGELKHGTLALIETHTPVVLLNPHDYTFVDTLSNGSETKARGARLIGVSDRSNEAYDAYIPLPQVAELFYPLVSVLPLQLLAYHAAVLRGHDVDRPRNLAKSVTVR
ncbi:glutamine--fructose-6-phosphate transaminase (isomerizing) [Candidatus Micrarchaeota archaeon]|nr:glutamine--fructose-6-phosphate transaminase (isomerizing) [Candidatus Micrarchaeota archaeon]